MFVVYFISTLCTHIRVYFDSSKDPTRYWKRVVYNIVYISTTILIWYNLPAFNTLNVPYDYNLNLLLLCLRIRRWMNSENLTNKSLWLPCYNICILTYSTIHIRYVLYHFKFAVIVSRSILYAHRANTRP